MRHFSLSTAILTIALSTSAHAQATITIINNDSPGEGFNDTTPVAAAPGNPGTTLGQQRLNAFRAAADDWGTVVSSPVEITVDAAMDPLTPCSATSGVLGRAGTLQVFRDFANAPQANTWYPSALANAIAGSDIDGAAADIQARFNSSVDNNNDCLNGTNWFYGIGAPAPANTISFFDVVKHELAHGLGVQSFVDIATTGELLLGRNDIFTNNLNDATTNQTWSVMTDAERLASATNSGQLHWLGSQVNACAAQILTAGTAGGNVRMFAPSPVQPGSSVSHFDTVVAPDELMEPFATATYDQRLTDRLLADIGWNVNSPSCGLGGLHVAALSPFRHPRAISTFHFGQVSMAHPMAISRIHQTRPSTFHFPIGSGHLSVLSPRHFPVGSLHGPTLSPHSPISSSPHSLVGSRFGEIDPTIPIDPPFGPGGPRFNNFGGQNPAMHFPVGSLGHNPVVSGHNFIVSGHNPPLSGHHPVLSGHNPIVSGHGIIASRHNPIFSGHNPFVSQPHNLIESLGHIPVLSRNPHNFVSSRFGGFDPNQPVLPGGNMQGMTAPTAPQAQQFGPHNPIVSFGHDQRISGHGVQVSIGHLPLQSELHGMFNSTGHSSFISSGHIPLTSTEHDPFLSTHNPIVSGHNHIVSGHDPIFSGHTPIVSGHAPFLSAPHRPLQSAGHHAILSRPPHSIVGSRFDPTGPVVIDPVFPNQSSGVGDPGMEQIPGNRAIRTNPGLPPGDPFTVPLQ